MTCTTHLRIKHLNIRHHYPPLCEPIVQTPGGVTEPTVDPYRVECRGACVKRPFSSKIMRCMVTLYFGNIQPRMKFLLYPFKFLDSILDRIFAIIGAILLSQIPAFITHYIQRLGGHVAEAQRNAQSWQDIANKTTDGNMDILTSEYLSSSIATTVEAGKKCLADVERLNELKEAIDAITNAPILTKSFSFLKHMDIDIARATLKSFVPNVPMNAESIAYAVAGLLLAMLMYKTLKWIPMAIGRRLLRRKGKDEESGVGDQESGSEEETKNA